MARFSKITKALLAEVVAIDDLNDALFRFQTAIGIDDGGVAGVVFSGTWDDEWPTASAERRHEMMAHYIGTERRMAGPSTKARTVSTALPQLSERTNSASPDVKT